MTTCDYTPTLPLVYSCSGCSSAAQMANCLALELDRKGVAEMSCITDFDLAEANRLFPEIEALANALSIAGGCDGF